jgi:hypothetical protein
MHVTLAAFADSASHTDDGKLTIAGIHNAVAIPQLPAGIVTKLVLRFTAEPEDAGREQRVALRILRPDGNELTTITAEPFTMDVRPGEPADLDQVLDLTVQVDAAGRWLFDVLVEGVSSMRLPLLVLERPELVGQAAARAVKTGKPATPARGAPIPPSHRRR